MFNLEKARILVIEDEPSIADTVIYALKTEGFDPLWRLTGHEGIEAVLEQQPALVILDIGLPDINGFELFKELRLNAPVPVIFLTARAEEVDRVVGLEIGADDYVVKPFSPRELTARVRAVLRRTNSHQDIADACLAERREFTMDTESCRIYYHGQLLALSRYEYLLLSILIKRPNRVYSREELLQLVWTDPTNSLDRTVDTHIKTIRAKLRVVKADANPIKTHRGLGYSLSTDG